MRIHGPCRVEPRARGKPSSRTGTDSPRGRSNQDQGRVELKRRLVPENRRGREAEWKLSVVICSLVSISAQNPGFLPVGQRKSERESPGTGSGRLLPLCASASTVNPVCSHALSPKPSTHFRSRPFCWSYMSVPLLLFPSPLLICELSGVLLLSPPLPMSSSPTQPPPPPCESLCSVMTFLPLLVPSYPCPPTCRCRDLTTASSCRLLLSPCFG